MGIRAFPTMTFLHSENVISCTEREAFLEQFENLTSVQECYNWMHKGLFIRLGRVRSWCRFVRNRQGDWALPA